MKENILYLAFWAWLISLNIMTHPTSSTIFLQTASFHAFWWLSNTPSCIYDTFSEPSFFPCLCLLFQIVWVYYLKSFKTEKCGRWACGGACAAFFKCIGVNLKSQKAVKETTQTWQIKATYLDWLLCMQDFFFLIKNIICEWMRLKYRYHIRVSITIVSVLILLHVCVCVCVCVCMWCVWIRVMVSFTFVFFSILPIKSSEIDFHPKLRFWLFVWIIITKVHIYARCTTGYFIYFPLYTLCSSSLSCSAWSSEIFEVILSMNWIVFFFFFCGIGPWTPGLHLEPLQQPFLFMWR
jgi:hypothetical protein